jgi:Na+/phosphate symporter
MKEEVKELLKAMHEMANNAENCMSFLQTSFIYNSSKPLKDCGSKIEVIKTAEAQLTKKVAELARDNPELKPYVSIPVHLLRIGENIEKLTKLMDKKIKDNILFSDRAVTEITFLLQRLIDVLRPTADMILARNTILRRYVEESEVGIVKRANEYATLHEERLIEGLCLPIASSLYINMLDSIKNIAWHAKEIATKLVEWSLPKAQ